MRDLPALHWEAEVFLAFVRSAFHPWVLAWISLGTGNFWDQLPHREDQPRARGDRLILRVLEYLLLSFFFQGCWAAAEPTAEAKPVQSHPAGWRCNVSKTAQGSQWLAANLTAQNKTIEIKQDNRNRYKKQIDFKLHFTVFHQCWISIIAKNKVGVEQKKVWKGEKEQSTPTAEK